MGRQQRARAECLSSFGPRRSHLQNLASARRATADATRLSPLHASRGLSLSAILLGQEPDAFDPEDATDSNVYRDIWEREEPESFGGRRRCVWTALDYPERILARQNDVEFQI